uniref:Uncharacterized protein n=1 Tax=Phlebotomus papatasi TaxID=29031 RepID=A0A1B0EZI5_PHLPP
MRGNRQIFAGDTQISLLVSASTFSFTESFSGPHHNEFVNWMPARHTKLEKADILEMTVKHLQTIQRQQFAMAVNTDPTVIHKFKSGFTDCAEEVTRYVNQMDGLDSGVKQRLANHLNNCVSNIQQLAPPLSFPQPPTGVGLSAFPGSIPMHGTGSSSSVIPMPQDVNNNGRIQMGGVQLIPSRLPTGELALVMPNSSNLSFFPSASPFSTPAPPPPSNLDLGAAYARSSAFSSVSRPAATRHSPPLSPVSSISSCGEDSHHSSDYQNSTASPPLVPSCSAATLPSNLQQPQVSSTTETQRARLESKPDIHYVNKKRPYPFDVSESTASKYEISAKAIKLEARGEPGPNFDHNQNSAQNGNTSADMWRPW